MRGSASASALILHPAFVCPKTIPAARRIADQIQRELADLIRLELKDPRVGTGDAHRRRGEPDQSHAKVFFTLLGDDAQDRGDAGGLKRAAGFLRTPARAAA